MSRNKAVVALNGERTGNYDFPDGAYIVACDAAYAFLSDAGISPDCVLGDFDSLGFVPQGALTFPVKKDKTDGELALEHCVKNGFADVDFINFGGGREDHFLGNLSLLIKAKSLGVTARAFTNNSVIYYIEAGKNEFTVKVGSIVSLFTFGECLVKKSSGLIYPYDNTTLTSKSTLGLSNEADKAVVSIDVASGGAFFIVNN